MTLSLALLIVAAICFGVATIKYEPARVSLVAAGLLALTIAQILAQI